jgi:hypothetical protein
MTPKDHHYICTTLFANGKFEEGALQALDWSNGARVSEGKTLEWRDIAVFRISTRTTHKSCLSVNWYRSKTKVMTDTYMFLHAEHWSCCCLHSLARLAVLLQEPNALVFPNLARSRLVTTMNSHFKEIYTKWQRVDAIHAARRKVEMAEGIFPEDEAFALSEGLTTHGNR